MTRSCFYLKEDNTRCGSLYNLKEVEFRHPDYEDLSKKILLCQNHFENIFGSSVLTVEHSLPLEEEIYLKQQWLNARQKYEKDKTEVVDKVRVGIGLENFDFNQWKLVNYKRVQDSFDRWNKLKRKTCRYEYCKTALVNFRNIYIIRLYPKTAIDYITLFFCCLDHWEVYKKKCGLVDMIGKLAVDIKKSVITLDTYSGEHIGVFPVQKKVEEI